MQHANVDGELKIFSLVAEKVKEQERKIAFLARQNTKSENEAYHKICKQLAYVDDGITVDPESTRKLIWQQEHATWHDPREMQIWGRLTCVEVRNELDSSSPDLTRSDRSPPMATNTASEVPEDDELSRIGFVPAVQKQAIDEIRAAGHYNAGSPWVKAINGDRCFYYHNDQHESFLCALEDDTEAHDLSLSPPQEGVNGVQVMVEANDEFERGFVRAVVEAEPGLCVVHQFTNHTPYRLETDKDRKEEYVPRGDWSKYVPPPAIIEPGQTKRWGSTTVKGYFGSSGTSASLLYRGVAHQSEHGNPTGAALSRETSRPLSEGEGFELILSHDCPVSAFTPRGAPQTENRAAGVIHDSCPMRYSSDISNFMRIHHKNTVHEFGTGSIRSSNLKQVKIGVECYKGPSRRVDGSTVLIIDWTLTQIKAGTEETGALQTAAALASLNKQHKIIWMLEDLLPATRNRKDAEAQGIMAIVSKEYWMESFATWQFDQNELPRGDGSGWLQVQVAPVGSFGPAIWLDVDVRPHTEVVEVGGTVSKHAGPEELMSLCVHYYKMRFAQTGNWREKLTEAMNDHSQGPAAQDSAAHSARMAAFAYEEAKELQETMQRNSLAKIGGSVDHQLAKTQLFVPQTVGEAKLAGAQSPAEGLLQTLEWKAIAWVQKSRSSFEAMQTMNPTETEKYKRAKEAVAKQWMAARTPAEITAAKKLKVIPKLMHDIPPAQLHFDESAALDDRRRWDHWQQADTGDVLLWVWDEYVDNVMLKKCTTKFKTSITKAAHEQMARLNKKLGMVLVVQTTIMSHDKREQLLKYYGSMAHGAVAALKRIGNETALKFGVHQFDIGLGSIATPLAVVTDVHDWLAHWGAHWWAMSESDSRRQIGIIAVLALALELGRREHEAKLLNSDTYKSNFINSCGRRYYMLCWRLLLISAGAVQIKCFSNVSDYVGKLIVTVCLVAIYLKVRSGISIILAIYVAVAALGFGQLTMELNNAGLNVHYPDLIGSEASRPLLILAHKFSYLLALVFRQLREEASVVLLHISFIAVPELVEFCWWQLSPALVLTAHDPSARRLASTTALGVKLCQRLGQYCLLFTALVCLDLDQRSRLPNEAPRPVWGRTAHSVYQAAALGVLVALSVRLVEPLLRLIARFIFASLSSWRSIVNSSSAFIYLIFVAKLVPYLQVVLHEVLSPLPTDDRTL
eukprot:COSAG02_NODE_1057_length_14906_cov_79.739853_5_plen_1192_part_00